MRHVNEGHTRIMRIGILFSFVVSSLFCAVSPFGLLASETEQKKSTVKVQKGGDKEKKKAQNALNVWLKKLKKRVSRSHAKHNQLVAVGAVRGNEAQDAPPLYWKGQKSKGPVDLPELNAFDAAVEEAFQGNTVESIAMLEKFIQAYPDSALREDAKHTIDMLSQTQP